MEQKKYTMPIDLHKKEHHINNKLLKHENISNKNKDGAVSLLQLQKTT